MAHHLTIPEDRRDEVKRRRTKAADFYEDQPLTHQAGNGDHKLYQVYSKGLQHDSLGVVLPNSYQHLLNALDSGKHADFEAIPVGFSAYDPKMVQKLTNPQAGLAFDTEGQDCFQYPFPPAPTFESRETMGEMAEDYWMALLRDVAFTSYASNPLAQQAADHLTTFGTDFKGPKVMNKVAPDTLFRAEVPGALTGPYLSQFLVWDIPFGAQMTDAKVTAGFLQPRDYLVDPAEYVAAQNGFVSSRPEKIPPLYLRSGREVSHYVHIDELFQGYLNACLLLITPAKRCGFEVPAAAGNPYSTSVKQTGFGTLGEPNFKVLVAEVATRALKAVWYQKWFVHRRLRPEVFAARIHFQKTAPGVNYNLNLSGMDPLLALVKQHNAPLYSGGDSYLLPVAFPEGSPTHPSYGAGHATVAGACVTLLKALFDTSMTFAGLGLTPKVIDASGQRVDWSGPASELTILGELNKLAANIGLSRNIAGVHWRSDFTQSLKLGECVALNFLRETASTYNEDVTFTIPRFFGGTTTIHKTDPKHWKVSDFVCS